MYFLFFLIIWTHFLQTSNNTKFLVFNEAYFQNNNSNNDLVFHQINTINFTFNFIANYKEIENQIFILPTNVITIPNYNPEKHDNLIKNLVQIKDKALLFYFKNSWSQDHFDLFCGCLSYANSQNKNGILQQNTIIDLLKFLTSKNDQMNAQQNINRLTSPNEPRILINIIVNKNKKEELKTIYNFFNTEQNPSKDRLQELFDNFWQKHENDTDTINIAQELNDAFAHYLEIFSQEEAEFNKKQEYQIDPIEQKIVGGIDKGISFLFKYGIPAAQLYSSYSLLKSNYQSIGSLKSFPSIPKTTAGKVKTLWNIYSVYSAVGMLYHYARNSFNWLKNKVYGTAQ